MIVHSYHPLGETRVEREDLALIDKGIAVDVICLRDNGDKVSEKVKGVQVFHVPLKWDKALEVEVLVQFLEYVLSFICSSIFMARPNIQNQFDVIQARNRPAYSNRKFIYNTIFGRLNENLNY